MKSLAVIWVLAIVSVVSTAKYISKEIDALTPTRDYGVSSLTVVKSAGQPSGPSQEDEYTAEAALQGSQSPQVTINRVFFQDTASVQGAR